MGFNCLKATEALQEDSLLFTTKFPEIHGTHSIGDIWPQQPYHFPASGNAPQYQPMKYFEYIGKDKGEMFP